MDFLGDVFLIIKYVPGDKLYSKPYMGFSMLVVGLGMGLSIMGNPQTPEWSKT